MSVLERRLVLNLSFLCIEILLLMSYIKCVCDSPACSRGISVRNECLGQRLHLRSLNLLAVNVCKKTAVDEVFFVAVESGAQGMVAWPVSCF